MSPHLRITTLLLLAGASVAACSGLREPPKETNANLAPADYKTKILAEMKSRLTDPTEVRDATLAEPTLKQTGTVQRYIACLRYNAKDETGKYSGLTERAIYFFEGDITQVVDDGAKELCRGAAYQPFPEMTRMCKEAVCPEKRR